MKNKIDLVNDCFSMLLRTGVTVQATNADIELALGRLEDVMAELESRNMATGYNFESPPQPDSPSGLEDYMNLAASRLLAMSVWPDFSPESVNPELIKLAAQSQSNLSARLAQQNALKYARRTPLGSGNQPYQQYNKFFGDYGSTCGPSDVSSGGCAPVPTPPPLQCSCDVIPLSHLKLLGDEALFGASEKQYSITGFYSGSTAGGGLFVFNPDGNKSTHNGVTVYSPEALQAWAGTPADIATLLNWTGVGSGVWVRIGLQGFVTPEMAGAVGDGVADDYLSLQSACDAVSLTGGNLLLADGCIYLINSQIVVKCAGDLPTTPSGSDIHFVQSNPVSIISDGMATIKAGAVMTAMVTYIFDSSDSDIAPFYSKVDSVTFDGGNVAQDCLYFNYAMHMHVERCRFWNYTGSGIRNFGYGVAQYIYNVFKGPRGIFIERGGDSLIQHNDFFPTTGGAAAVDCGYFSGNTSILNNVFTREEAIGSIYSIRLSGDYASTGSQEARHIEIVGNEFCGMTAGVYSQAFSTGARNVYQCSIRSNHVTPWPGSNMGVLADLNSSEGFIIIGNWINKVGFGDATAAAALRLNNCIGMHVTDNKFQSLQQQAIRLIDCADCKVEQNEFTDCGKLGASYLVVGVSGASSGNEFKNNKFKQSSASYAQNGIYEFAGAGGGNNIGRDNTFTNIATPYFKGNATSTFWRNELGSAKPTSGRYHSGDVVNNTSPAVAGAASSQYTISGWLRLTDGVNHVLNTDWVEQRALTGT